MLREVATRLAGHSRISELVIPTTAVAYDGMLGATRAWPMPVRVCAVPAEKAAAFADAVAAVAVSGTVTLELALAGVPTVSTYVGDAGQAKRFAKYKVKFVALPNIVLDRQVVPELLFTVPDPIALTEAARRLLDDRSAADDQLAAFSQLRALMETGEPEHRAAHSNVYWRGSIRRCRSR